MMIPFAFHKMCYGGENNTILNEFCSYKFSKMLGEHMKSMKPEEPKELRLKDI